MQNHFAIGIDLGTSGVRACLLNGQQAVISLISMPLYEQSPQHWWEQSLGCLDQLMHALHRHIAREKIHQFACRIALDATSSTVLLQHTITGEALSPARLYNHAATSHFNERVKQKISLSNAAHAANSTLSKSLELLDTYPPNDKHWLVCHQADWIYSQLLGKTATISDENNALKLGYDLQHQQWPSEITHLISEEHLPRIVPPGTVIGPLSPTLCQRWQLPASTELVAGTTDSIAALLATGANQLGDAVISLGSTLAFKLICDKPVNDSRQGIYSHKLGKHWLVSGASNAGGQSLLDHFSLDDIKKLAIQPIRPSLNLGYYPLPLACTGERFPIADTHKTGRYEPKPHNEHDFFQGILEGLVEIEATGWQSLIECSEQPIKRLIAVGGGCRNDAWMQLRKAKLNYPEQSPLHEEACVGSALLALRSCFV